MNKQLFLLGTVLLGGANAQICGDGTDGGFANCDASAEPDLTGYRVMKDNDNAVYRHTGLGFTQPSLDADTCAFGQFVQVPICGDGDSVNSCDSSGANAGLNTQCTCDDGFSLSGLGDVKSYQPFVRGNQLTFFLEGEQEGPPSESNPFFSNVGAYLRQNYCQASTCTNNVNVGNSKNAATEFDNMVTGATVEHQCSDGYNAGGEFAYAVECTAVSGAATATIKNNLRCAASTCTNNVNVENSENAATEFDNMVTGDTVEHQCSDGYNAGGAYTYAVECSAVSGAATASITNNLVCAASTCAANDDANSATDTSGLVTGDEVSIQCNDGYNANGAFVYAATCTADTDAAIATIKNSNQCAPSACAANDDANSATDTSGLVTGDEVSIQCNDGYNANGAFTYDATCTADTGEAIATIKDSNQCAPSACTNDVNVDNSENDATEFDNMVTGATVEHQCSDGYNAGGAYAYAVECTAVSGAATATIKNNLRCAASTCTNNVNVENSENAATEFDNMVTGDTVEHQCSDGYNAGGAYTYAVECSAVSGAATASITNNLVCAASTCAANDDANSATDTSGLVTGDEVSIQCNDGYNANGAFVYAATCTADTDAAIATIKNSNQCAPSACAANDDANSATDTSGLVTGDEVSIQCNDGYNANGAFTYDATCTADTGEAIATIKDSNQCAPSACVSVDIANSVQERTGTAMTGQSVTIQCSEGYGYAINGQHIDTSYEAVCTAETGAKTAQFVTYECVDIQECEESGFNYGDCPTNSKCVNTLGSHTCECGYEQEPAAAHIHNWVAELDFYFNADESTCGQCPTHIGAVAPTCPDGNQELDICDNPIPAVECSDASTTIIRECALGYWLGDTEDQPVTDENKQCIHCDKDFLDTNNIPYRYIDENDNEVVGTWVDDFPGGILCGSGMPGQTWLQSDALGDYMNDQNELLAICKSFSIANSDYANVLVTGLTNHEVPITCNDGYKLSGASGDGASFTAKCMSTGLFVVKNDENTNAEDITCVPAQCPSINIAHSNYVDGTPTNQVFGGTFDVTCDNGYGGSGQASCVADGSTPSDTTDAVISFAGCTPIACEQIGIPHSDKPDISDYAQLVMDEDMDYNCDAGYIPSTGKVYCDIPVGETDPRMTFKDMDDPNQGCYRRAFDMNTATSISGACTFAPLSDLFSFLYTANNVADTFSTETENFNLDSSVLLGKKTISFSLEFLANLNTDNAYKYFEKVGSDWTAIDDTMYEDYEDLFTVCYYKPGIELDSSGTYQAIETVAQTGCDQVVDVGGQSLVTILNTGKDETSKEVNGGEQVVMQKLIGVASTCNDNDQQDIYAFSSLKGTLETNVKLSITATFSTSGGITLSNDLNGVDLSMAFEANQVIQPFDIEYISGEYQTNDHVIESDAQTITFAPISFQGVGAIGGIDVTVDNDYTAVSCSSQLAVTSMTGDDSGDDSYAPGSGHCYFDQSNADDATYTDCMAKLDVECKSATEGQSVSAQITISDSRVCYDSNYGTPTSCEGTGQEIQGKTIYDPHHEVEVESIIIQALRLKAGVHRYPGDEYSQFDTYSVRQWDESQGADQQCLFMLYGTDQGATKDPFVVLARSTKNTISDLQCTYTDDVTDTATAFEAGLTLNQGCQDAVIENKVCTDSFDTVITCSDKAQDNREDIADTNICKTSDLYRESYVYALSTFYKTSSDSESLADGGTSETHLAALLPQGRRLGSRRNNRYENVETATLFSTLPSRPTIH